MGDQYITAAEAYDRLDPVVVGSPAYTICPRARDGILVARAKVLFWGDEKREDCEIPTQFWWAGAESALEQNWRSGDFSTWLNRSVQCRAYGVTFKEADIEAMMPPNHGNDRLDGVGFASSANCVSKVCELASVDAQTAVRGLIKHCAAGLIASECSRFWWRVTDRYDDEFEEELEGSIPDWFWEKCADHSDTIFDWRSGKVSSLNNIDEDQYKVVVNGVRFDERGVSELAAMLLADSASQKNKAVGNVKSGRGGRKRDQEKWDAWIAELAAYIHDAGIPEGQAADGQDELIAAIDTRLTEQGLPTLSRTTVQSAARAALLRLRSAGN